MDQIHSDLLLPCLVNLCKFKLVFDTIVPTRPFHAVHSSAKSRGVYWPLPMGIVRQSSTAAGVVAVDL